jgi:hypothetical protein
LLGALMPPRPILFTVDTSLPWIEVDAILDGFDVQAPPEGLKSQAILAAAEVDGSIIITSENWIYSQLRRIPTLDRGLYRKAGVVKVPGIWTVAQAYLARWLPVITAIHEVVSQEADQRVVVEIRDNGAVYIDP